MLFPNPPIAQSNWLAVAIADGVWTKTAALWASGRIPKNIEGFMLVTPLRRLLRCIYGSNLAAAEALMEYAKKEVRDE